MKFSMTLVIFPAQKSKILPFLTTVEFYKKSEEALLAEAHKKNWAKQLSELLCWASSTHWRAK